MFRIGEFSHLARVSKRLLHFYDEVGLLKPAYVDPQAGYRFYSTEQLPRLNRILALKDLGIPLEQITQLVHSQVSDNDIQRLLLHQKAEVEQKLQQETQRLRRIEARLQQNQQPDDLGEVVVKAIPTQQFLSLRTTMASPDEMVQLLHLIQHAVPPLVDRRALGPIMAVIHTPEFRLRHNDVEVGYLLKKPIPHPIRLSEAYALCPTDVPATATMATSVQKGGFDLVFMALGRVGRWIERNGYRIAGPYREIGLELPSSRSFSEMVIEVHVPVEVTSAMLSATE